MFNFFKGTVMFDKKNKSGVSIAMKQTLSLYDKGQPLFTKEDKSDFTIKIANTLEEREAVFRLGYQVYLEKGYIKENYNEWLVQNYDSCEETIIFIVQDQFKNIAGSVTLLFDKNARLPVEKIYPDEVKELKKTNPKIGELSRLVVSPEYRNSKSILVLLFNYLAIYLHSIKEYDGLVVQVNPRHKTYYKSLLSFDEIGSEKPCPQVQNAPAILLFLSTKKYYAEMSRCKSELGSNKKERTLYPYFLNPEQEKLVAYYLEKQAKPISADEKLYFGLSQSGTGQTIAV
jgi:N-acyl-L-homoserine lactone synthetase